MEQRTLAALGKFYPDAAEFESKTITDLFALADLVDDIECHIRQIAEGAGMPSIHFFLLEHLALNEGAASLGELLSALNLPKQSATYVIDRLEKDGLVERRTDKRDRRRFEVALTRKGRRRVKADLAPFYGTMLQAMQAVSKRDRTVLLRGLKVFLQALRESQASTGSADS